MPNRFKLPQFYVVFTIALLLNVKSASADDAANPQVAEDAQREQAIAEYTQKMRDANYPALFDKAATEFNVPSDVLKAVSFAETRWTQLQWPPGETVSPENGMPRAYGIMSLWDNDYFGHTLQQAAQLIGQDPEVLKNDAFQNMRGGAALLRQLYDQTPKPADAPNESQIESWRKAIAKYTGIPQPELSEAHALRVYEFMNQGFHQYGIDWNAHPVNLGPMRDEVAKIRTAASLTNGPAPLVAEEKAKPAPVPTPTIQSISVTPPVPVAAETPPHPHDQNNAENLKQRKILGTLMVFLLLIAGWYLFRGRQKTSET